MLAANTTRQVIKGIQVVASQCLAVQWVMVWIALSAIIVETASGNDRPNIVLINLDDADRDMLGPNTIESKFPSIAEIAARGMTFTNFYVCSPKCGPSRACLLRGQYAHAINHRTNEFDAPANRGFTGGFTNFMAQGFYDDDLGKWMKNGGYETVFVGKYLNGATDLAVPSGWDHFYLSRGSEYYLTHRFTNRDKSKPKPEVTPPGVYRTDAEVNDILQVIGNELSDQKPFMIYFAPFGPHTEGKALGGMVANELVDWWPNIKPIRQADFNEKNNLDKPLVYRQLPPLTFEDTIDIQVTHRKRMLAVKSIDDGLAKIVAALKSKGLYNNTYFLITSDNGFSLGQHRVSGKGKTFSRATHVPLIVAGPGIPRNTANAALTSQIDLAPTILNLGGISQKPFFDGKSLLPLLSENNPLTARDFRDSLLIENWETSGANPFLLKTTFTQLRTPTESYTQWADGTREYYNLAADPLELRNRVDQLSDAQVQTFQAQMFAHRQPMPEPITTFELPATDYEESVIPPFTLTGLAEDSAGIRKVDVVIRAQQSKKYWNGSAWQDERAAIPTNLLNPNGIQTEWTCSFDPPAPNNAKESYLVTARGYSHSGLFSKELPKRRFKYDSVKPVTIVKNPRVRTNGTVILWGTSSDNFRLKHTELVIQDLGSQKYFDGNTWSVERRSIKVLSDENGDWEWMSPDFASGNFVMRARAVDAAGNFDSIPVVRKFTVE